MLTTFVLLLVAHVAADFVFQTRRVAENKHDFKVLAEHGVWVLLAAIIALGAPISWQAGVAAALLVASHAAIDWLKAAGRLRALGGFGAFVADQAMHIGVILALAAAFPTLAAGGVWFDPPSFWPSAWLAPPGWASPLLVALLVLAGFLFAVRAGGFAIQALTRPFLEQLKARESADADPGLANGGAVIGYLERALVYGLCIVGEIGAVGFLVAAKSVLRFQYAHDRSHSEYVIIGTLASFGWAAATGLAVQALVVRLVSA